MNESLWEEAKREYREREERETKRRERMEYEELKNRAIMARYHIMQVSERRYAVIRANSWCLTEGREHSVFTFVPGLERVLHDDAESAVWDLNRGLTKEKYYA